jgi:hypothetical protein
VDIVISLIAPGLVPSFSLDYDHGQLDINSGNSSSGSPVTSTARHILVMDAITVEPTGYADFHASSGVDMQNIVFFGAEQGSRTHIYCLPVDFDCSKLLSPDYIHGPKPPVNLIKHPLIPPHLHQGFIMCM